MVIHTSVLSQKYELPHSFLQGEGAEWNHACTRFVDSGVPSSGQLTVN